MAGRSLGDPLLCLSGGIALVLAIAALYETLGDGVVPAALVSTPTAAQTVLSSIATAMITLLTLVLTVTTVAVQLAMGQFSPGSCGRELQDRPSQFAHGLFLATFAYALLVIRAVRDGPENGPWAHRARWVRAHAHERFRPGPLCTPRGPETTGVRG
jgi:uncharacterized membrane protein